MRLRLTITVVSTLALATGSPALAATPVTMISAAGTAVDTSPVELAGNIGPCALALAASVSARDVAGAGSLVASRGTGSHVNESACGRGGVTLRFAVVGSMVNGGRAVLRLRVTESDAAHIVGAPGVVQLDSERDSIHLQIAGYRASLDGDMMKRDTIERRADVRIAEARAEAVTHYSGTGTSVDIGATPLYGDCAVAIAGAEVIPPDPALSPAGNFTAILGAGRSGAETGTCLGGLASFSFAVDELATDGQTTAAIGFRVSESDAGPAPGMTGSITIDETDQVVGVALRRQSATFGPGRTVVAATVETRAGAAVDTHLLAAR